MSMFSVVGILVACVLMASGQDLGGQNEVPEPTYVLLALNGFLTLFPLPEKESVIDCSKDEYIFDELQDVGAMTAIPFSNTSFLSDLSGHHIYMLDFSTFNLTLRVENAGVVYGLSYDEVGHNLYWVDAERKSILVLSLLTDSILVLSSETEVPMDILVLPDDGILFVALWTRKGGQIVSMAMNGMDRKILADHVTGDPSSLHYVKKYDRLYWIDSDSGYIHYIDLQSLIVYSLGPSVNEEMTSTTLAIASSPSSLYTLGFMLDESNNFTDIFFHEAPLSSHSSISIGLDSDLLDCHFQDMDNLTDHVGSPMITMGSDQTFVRSLRFPLFTKILQGFTCR